MLKPRSDLDELEELELAPEIANNLRKVDFYISTSKGLTVKIGKQLLLQKEVFAAYQSIGEPSIDLRVETRLKDNAHILDMLEIIKGTDGVTHAVWSEIVQVIGKKDEN